MFASDVPRQWLINCRFMVETRLEELIRPADNQVTILHEAMRYSLLSSGKRLRPLLTLAVAAHFRCDPSRAIDTACAMEMMHTASLIYDDLPAMDDDDMRRGRTALHRKYEESVALLAAIALMNRAYGVIAACDRIADAQKIKLSGLLAELVGADGLCAGQYADLHEKPRDRQGTRTEQLHYLKTGVLFVGAASAGAQIAGASEEQENKVRRYAHSIGLAFQLQDDLQDELRHACPAERRRVEASLEHYLETARSLIEDRSDSPLPSYMEMLMEARPLAVADMTSGSLAVRA